MSYEPRIITHRGEGTNNTGDGPAKQAEARASAGVKHDQGKPMLALIPAEAIEEEGLVWTFGANKYGNYNWLGGLSYLRILSALLRHTFAILRGEDRDPESGFLHAAHIRCCAGMLITFSKQDRKELDDRYKP